MDDAQDADGLTSLADISERYGSLLRLVDDLHCGLLITDGASTTLFANARLTEWMGAEPGGLLGDNRSWIPPEDEAAVEAERDLILAGDVRARILVLRRFDGTTFPALVLPHRLATGADVVGLAFLVIELSTVQTARRIGEFSQAGQMETTLQTIAIQLRQLVDAGSGQPPRIDLRHPDLRDISPRELEVLDLLLQGERVASIAEQLFISAHTVRNHLKSMFRKTGTASQADLVRWVRELA
jgi:DNA-binding CsgD family transcriptional regulator